MKQVFLQSFICNYPFQLGIHDSGLRHIYMASSLQNPMKPPRPTSVGKLPRHYQGGYCHHTDGGYFGDIRHCAVLFPVMIHVAEIAVLVQPAVKARGCLCSACGGEQYERRGRQQRQKNADDTQQWGNAAAGNAKITYHFEIFFLLCG